mgnify:CR=1 FL=1|tara:strand:+ start:125 stop:595 length:471 start_codon:yes stop_codon:yes gene_type:complete
MITSTPMFGSNMLTLMVAYDILNPVDQMNIEKHIQAIMKINRKIFIDLKYVNINPVTKSFLGDITDIEVSQMLSQTDAVVSPQYTGNPKGKAWAPRIQEAKGSLREIEIRKRKAQAKGVVRNGKDFMMSVRKGMLASMPKNPIAISYVNMLTRKYS